MNLDRRLSEWDGRDVAVLEDVIAAARDEGGFVDELLGHLDGDDKRLRSSNLVEGK